MSNICPAWQPAARVRWCANGLVTLVKVRSG
jgi:hypothetical protein